MLRPACSWDVQDTQVTAEGRVLQSGTMYEVTGVGSLAPCLDWEDV